MKKKLSVFLAVMMLCIAVMPSRVLANVQVNSAAAVIMDYETGEVLFEKNMNATRVPASMTKVLTTFIVFQEIEAGRLSRETELTVSANAARISADPNMQGSPVPLPSGAKITVDKLLHLALLPSSNGANVVFAEHISGSEAAFAQRMNEVGKEIGMTHVDFNNAHGALVNHTNAYSMALLIREFITRYPEILEITSTTRVDFNGRSYSNTNLLLNSPSWKMAGVDGFKTGTTREAGYNLSATRSRNGVRVITVVMGGGSDNDRYGDTTRLLNWGLDEAEKRKEARTKQAEIDRIKGLEEMAVLFEKMQQEQLDRQVKIEETDIRVIKNGVEQTLEHPVVYGNGIPMLPLREVVTLMNGTLEFNGAHGYVDIRHNMRNHYVMIDTQLAVVSGNMNILSVPTTLVEETLYVSYELIEAIIGQKVTYTPDAATISFSSTIVI